MRDTLLLSDVLASRKGGGVATYTVSGTVTGNVVEDVTVTLTGDADDSTTTDGDGNYEFTGLADGSYTVTPTKDSTEFTPTSAAVEVSGADNTGNDFVSTSILSLPFLYSVSDLAAGAGTAVNTADSRLTQTISLGGAATITTSVLDAANHTPSGVTKAISMPSGGRNQILFNPGGVWRGGNAVMRLAILCKCDQSAQFPCYLNASEAATITGGSESIAQYSSSGVTNSLFWLSTRYATGQATVTEMNFAAKSGNIGSGSPMVSNYWRWLYFQADHTADTVVIYNILDSSGGTNGQYRTQTMSASGQSINETFDVLSIVLDNPSSDAQTWIAKFWIGTGNDDWPR